MGYGAHARLKTTLRARTKQQAGAYAWRPTLPYIRLYLEYRPSSKHRPDLEPETGVPRMAAAMPRTPGLAQLEPGS